jgi:hypothetical protein
MALGVKVTGTFSGEKGTLSSCPSEACNRIMRARRPAWNNVTWNF